MKLCIFFSIILSISFSTFAQEGITVCGTTPNATEEFAQLASFADFRNQHPNPQPYVRMNALGKMITFSTPGGQEGHAYAITTDGSSNEYLFVFHEWWGLNEHIKEEADRLSQELNSVNVIALDLYDGEVATSREEAQKLVQSVKTERAEAIINGAIDYVGDEANIATIGWCFGGGWSLQATILADEQAAGCVMYYGMPVKDQEKIAAIDADVLGIFASQDQHITPQIVKNFEQEMNAADKDITIKMYDADHAFANPSSPRYKEQAAQEANEVALAFLKGHL